MRANFRPSVSATLLPSEVLPTPGGPDQAENRPLDLLLQLDDGQKFQQPVLHLSQAEMLLIQDAFAQLSDQACPRWISPTAG